MSSESFPLQPSRRLMLWGVRILLILCGLAAWFLTQRLIGGRPYKGVIGDELLQALSPVHDFLLLHLTARNALLIASSAVIDLLALFMFIRAIFGPTVRPFVAILLIFALRQVFQALCVLPAPAGMIWPKEGPGFPSLFVTYGVGNDLFFSGHTALAVYGATELARVHRALIPVGILLAFFEMFAVLVLRAHWTMDVYAGAVTALLIALIADKITRPVDRVLAKITGTRPLSTASG